MNYVIKINNTPCYVGIDETSGGYPYETEIRFAKIWNSIENAIEYMAMFKNENWDLYELHYETKLVDITKLKS